ncbi:hypothetical protein D5086_017900 [Populus alba]|uniref:Uncharacterized protein n=1 Tax=Populus alba TaxID=43335 RepID=A0ACC4BP06_POPAL
MGNCCFTPSGASSSEKKVKGKKKQNPFFGDSYAVTNGSGNVDKLWVLKEPTGRDILAHYDLGRELGRGSFTIGIFYFCIVFAVIAEHLSVEEVAGIKEAFDMMDTGKRGSINLEELRVGLQKLGQNIADADLRILMEAADVDGDGALNYGEFVAISVHIKKMGNDEHLHKAFAFFDRNQSGYIEIEELRESLNDDVDTNIEDVINAIMHDVDTDKAILHPVLINQMLEPETLQALSLSRDISGSRTPCDLQIQQGAEYQKGVAQ